MGAIAFYLVCPLIYLLGKSPFWLIYRVSDMLYLLVYYLIGYRKKVVLENLNNAFPEKPEEEINKICKDYYRYLCDLLVETLKTVGITEKEVRDHITFKNVELLDKYYEQDKSVILALGHFGNWELAGPCFSLNCKHTLNVVYKPLSQKRFEKMFVKARTKFNTEITPMKNTLRQLVANRKRLTATALAADQSPSDSSQGLWVDFLNQETLVFTGPEKLAKKFDYPVVYLKFDRVARGKYDVIPTILCEDPKNTSDNEITLLFNRKLEEDIRQKPEIWLWSHRRWKHKRQ